MSKLDETVKRASRLTPLEIKLRDAIRDYLSEIDNPCPDYAYRHTLRSHMRHVLNKANRIERERGK